MSLNKETKQLYVLLGKNLTNVDKESRIIDNV